jgi:hypothetical protein
LWRLWRSRCLHRRDPARERGDDAPVLPVGFFEGPDPVLHLGYLEDEQAAISSHRKHIFAIADETSSLEESFAENRADPMTLGDKPLMVLTAGSVQTEGTSLSPQQAEQLDKLHSESQAALTKRSENTRQIIAEDSGHYIQVEQPALVIDAVRTVVDAARDGSRL